MAGRGPAPKAPSERRRTNKPARGEWVDLPLKLRKKLLGPLPRRPRTEKPWHPRTRSAWESWRKDPATTQWSDADFDSALTLAHEFDTWAYEGGVSRLAELRKWMDMLGLTPKGKRDNRWRVAVDEPEPERQPPLAEVRKLRAV
jgi:hypothetical protein